jgi:8-oxo-dGTP diphosphatase
MNFKTFFESLEEHESASMILRDDKGYVLILHRSSWLSWAPNTWGLPGGSMESGEEPDEAAIRECIEETRLEPSNVKKFKTYYFDESTHHVFTGEIHKGKSGVQKPQLNNEHRSYDWISINEIEDYDFAPNVKQILQEYFSKLNI